MTKSSRAGFILWLVLGWTAPAHALNIILNDIGDVALTPSARAGFEAAAARWERIFADPVTIRVDVGFQPLSPGVLGETSTETVGLSYTDVRTALIADQRSSDDATAVSSLENQAGFRFITNNPLSPGSGFIFNNAGFGLDTVLDVSRANAKALGLLANNFAADATITFNSNFTFDFNPGNGITAGAFDFVGVATHEIGHALGFISGVDVIDLVSRPNGPFRGCCGINLPPTSPLLDLLDFRVFSVLDLYRYSDFSLSFGPFRDLATPFPNGVGGTPFFSIDGGATDLGLFSTGQFNGDGRQASHWKDNLGLGIMDPTAAPGELLQIRSLDRQALDAIGWDLAAVPEPSTIFLMLSGLAGLIGFTRTRL